jgi:hypothetical protein
MCRNKYRNDTLVFTVYMINWPLQMPLNVVIALRFLIFSMIMIILDLIHHSFHILYNNLLKQKMHFFIPNFRHVSKFFFAFLKGTHPLDFFFLKTCILM